MSNKIWDDKSTDLSLNGPRLSFSSDVSQNITNVSPNGQTGRTSDSSSVVFTGTAVCQFPDGSNADGTINYQWYDANTNQALGISTQYSGQDSNTLTWNYALSNQDNSKSFYLQADFIPTVGGTSGEPRNEPLRSTSNVDLNVLPELFVKTGPSTSTVPINVDTTFNCVGGINVGRNTSYETSEENNISYQWYIDGVAVTDGVRETTRSANNIRKQFVGRGDRGEGDRESIIENIQTVEIPDDATNVTITVTAGAGGAGGFDSNGTGGAGGEGKSGKFSLADGGRTLTLYIGGRGRVGLNEDAGIARGGEGGSSTFSKGGKGGDDGAGGSGGGGGGAGGRVRRGS